MNFDTTGLLPRQIAEDVLRQRGLRDMTLIDYVEVKTMNVFRVNERFRQALQRADDPRPLYRMYVEHWIEGEAKRRTKLMHMREEI